MFQLAPPIATVPIAQLSLDFFKIQECSIHTYTIVMAQTSSSMPAHLYSKQLWQHWTCPGSIMWRPVWATPQGQQLWRESAEAEDPKGYQGGLACEFTSSFPTLCLPSQLPPIQLQRRQWKSELLWAPQNTDNLWGFVSVWMHECTSLSSIARSGFGLILSWKAPMPSATPKSWASIGPFRQKKSFLRRTLPGPHGATLTDATGKYQQDWGPCLVTNCRGWNGWGEDSLSPSLGNIPENVLSYLLST